MFFKWVGIVGEHSGNSVHLDVDRSKIQEAIWVY